MTFAPALLAIHLLAGLPAATQWKPGDSIQFLRPGGPAKIYLTWGRSLRLDPVAEQEGWRMAVDTWNGALRPSHGEPGLFNSKCVGTTSVALEHPDDGPFAGDRLAFAQRIEVEVVPFFVGGNPPYFPDWKCHPPDPPTRRIHGALTAQYMGDGIILRVGDGFVLVPPENCRTAWNDVRLEGQPTVVRVADDPRGPRFRAVRAGQTELNVPLRRSCSPGRDLPFVGERERVLLLVEARTPGDDAESDDFRGAQERQPDVEPDPPELVKSSIAVRPRMGTVRLEVGQLVRLDSAAREEGWRIGAQTSNGVLWPVKGAPRVFRARCPGKSHLAILHVEDVYAYPINDNSVRVIHDGERPREGGADVEVVASASAIPKECGRSFDPPRTRIQGELDPKNMNRGIVLSVGQRFVLIPPEFCRQAWNDVKLEDMTVVERLPDDSRGPAFRALRRGSTELSVPYRLDCTDAGYQYKGDREKALLVVE